MQTLADKLKAIGFRESPMLGPPKPPAHLLKANARFHASKPKAVNPKHFADVAQVMRQSMRNPSTSGSMHTQARLVQGAGSDIGRAYKLSGPSVKFGWKGARGGQSHADEKSDYWVPKK